MRDTYTQMLRLAFAIVLLALALYWADASYFSKNRLPPCVQEKLPPHHICLDTLQSEWKGKILWVDARSLSDYEINHLMLSENRAFPLRSGADYEQLFDAAIGRLIEAEENGECVVVFCTVSCSASEDIAARLRDCGMISAPIYVLEGGWDALKSDKSLVP